MGESGESSGAGQGKKTEGRGHRESQGMRAPPVCGRKEDDSGKLPGSTKHLFFPEPSSDLPRPGTEDSRLLSMGTLKLWVTSGPWLPRLLPPPRVASCWSRQRWPQPAKNKTSCPFSLPRRQRHPLPGILTCLYWTLSPLSPHYRACAKT